MKNILFFTVLCTFLAPSPVAAKLYKWVDASGKVTYSNTAPPSSAKVVKESRETAEHPAAKAARLEQQHIEAEAAAELERLRQERQRIIREEQRRIAEERSYREQQTIQHSAAPQKSIGERRIAEEELLRDKLDIDLRGCSRRKGKMKKNCIKRLKGKYYDKIARLRHYPEEYFAAQERKEQYRNSEEYKQKKAAKKTRSNIINAQTGEVLTPSGGGYVGSRDGTFYQEAAGGVINTRTGDFLPTH